MNKVKKEVADRADEIQKELHGVINKGINGAEVMVSYQDYINTYFIYKIATLELEIEKLKNK